MSNATIDLRRYGDVETPRIDSRIRTGIFAIIGAGASATTISILVSLGGFDPHVLAVVFLADTIVLLTLVAYMSLSTRTAVAQVRQQIVGDVVAQVSAVVASRVAHTLEGEVARARGRQDVAALADLTQCQQALTKELARLRGQTTIGLRDLADAVERVEGFVKADVAVAYELGKQSTRS